MKRVHHEMYGGALLEKVTFDHHDKNENRRFVGGAIFMRLMALKT